MEKALFNLGFLMNRVLPVKRTILLKFQLLLCIPPVFTGGIVFPLALGALKRYQFHHLFLARHIPSPVAYNTVLSYPW